MIQITKEELDMTMEIMKYENIKGFSLDQDYIFNGKRRLEVYVSPIRYTKGVKILENNMDIGEFDSAIEAEFLGFTKIKYSLYKEAERQITIENILN